VDAQPYRQVSGSHGGKALVQSLDRFDDSESGGDSATGPVLKSCGIPEVYEDAVTQVLGNKASVLPDAFDTDAPIRPDQSEQVFWIQLT
jgi:hypothetical protein